MLTKEEYLDALNNLAAVIVTRHHDKPETRANIKLLADLIHDYFELIERKNRWKEIAHNLDEGLREYQRKYGE